MTIQEHEQELADLQTFFKTASFPPSPFHLNKYIILHNPEQFVEQEIAEIQKYQGSDIVRDYRFKHLRELKALVLQNHNGGH